MPSDSPADFPGRNGRRRYPLAVHISTLFGVLLLLTLVGWHSKEPQDS